MTETALSHVIQQLRRNILRRDGAGFSDGQLLDCFIAFRDEAAFEALVRRHQAMVFGVCRRLLKHPEDAEDAFQATFLILARKAAGIVPREMVANWLHGVARRTALKLRAGILKRQAREKSIASLPEPEAQTAHPDRDWRPILDEALRALPEKYRAALVICDLEGRTRREAAQYLGWPEGTVAGRLSRARELLANRLVRRGLIMSAGSLAASLAQEAPAATIPLSLAGPTIKLAMSSTTSKAFSTGVISAKSVVLAQEVLRAMFLAKIKVLLAAILTIGVIGVGIGLASRSAPANSQWESIGNSMAERHAPAVETQDQAQASPEARFTEELAETASKAWSERRKEFLAGRGTLFLHCQASQRLLDADLEKARTKDQRIAAWAAQIKRMQEVFDLCKQRYEAGRVTYADYLEARYALVEAQLGLERAKKRP
jgi:RNA polymerase sigma factor (sigma-70 family)